MKKKIYIAGLIAAIIIATGILFKLNHWPGAGIMITVGIGMLVLLFLPLALINNYIAGNRQNLSLYIVTWITCFVVFGSMLFKIQHWPGAGYTIIVALPFPYVIFLPVYLYVTGKDKNHNIYNTVFVLLLLASVSVLSALLSLNVSRERILDSYNLSGHYNRLEAVMNKLPGIKGDIPGKNINPSITGKIDELIKVINDYQNLIFTSEGITKEQWNTNPEILKKPDNGSLAARDILKDGESFPGEKLEVGINSLIKELEKTAGLEELAKAVPLIFNYKEAAGEAGSWASGIFIQSSLAGSLIYLDGLKVNLLMIKTSLPSAP